MKIRSMSVAVLAAVPLAVAGCSQEAPSAPPAQSQAPQNQAPQNQAQAPQNQPGQAQPKPAASPEGIAWVDQMCGYVGGFAAAQKNAPAVDKSSTGKFKESSVVQMTAAEKVADDTVNGLRGMPPSPVEGGNQVSNTFADGFVQVRDILTNAKGKAEQVDPSNQQAFAAGMVGVQEELKKGEGLSFQPQFTEFSKNPELATAADQAPQCRAMVQQTQQKQPPQQAPQPPG